MSVPITVTKYLCIGCPLGCSLEVEHSGQQIHDIRGYQCKRGKDFAISEHTDPRRTLTTTVRVIGGTERRLPVKTEKPIPRDKVLRLRDELRRVTVKAPIRTGDVILPDVLGLGSAVVATRDIKAV
ncbi:MAG: DUF1667 domain-containing protein [Firmicutes bacterium]|jgi:CxxC motif-containing protein|nr:DUF1667 domain-containing protein [Bacillota bacterium]